MNWKTFFQLRPSVFLITLFGIICLALGYFNEKWLPTPSQPSSQAASKPNQNILSFFLTPAIFLAGLAFVHRTISLEIEAASEEKAKSEADKFAQLYYNDFNALKEEIISLKIPPEKFELISMGLAKLESAHKKFQDEINACKEIAKWLARENNKIALLNAAMSSCTIPDKYQDSFEKDMEECIQYLQRSMDRSRPGKVRVERYTSTMAAGMSNDAQFYKIALNAIKDKIKAQQSLQKSLSETNMLDISFNCLMHEI